MIVLSDFAIDQDELDTTLCLAESHSALVRELMAHLGYSKFEDLIACGRLL